MFLFFQQLLCYLAQKLLFYSHCFCHLFSKVPLVSYIFSSHNSGFQFAFVVFLEYFLNYTTIYIYIHMGFFAEFLVLTFHFPRKLLDMPKSTLNCSSIIFIYRQIQYSLPFKITKDKYFLDRDNFLFIFSLFNRMLFLERSIFFQIPWIQVTVFLEFVGNMELHNVVRERQWYSTRNFTKLLSTK